MPTPLLDNLGCYRWGHIDPERPRCLQIDDKLKFGGLLDRQVARFGALENLVYVACATFEQIDEVWAVTHQSAYLGCGAPPIDRWQTRCPRHINNMTSFRPHYRFGNHDKTINTSI